MRRYIRPLICATALALVPTAHAQDPLQPPIESSKVVGPYEILYSVMPTTFISESVAASYQIVRGNDQALINVSVRKRDGSSDVAHAATVSGSYSDLMQSKPLAFREIREQGAIYYIAAFRHGDKELLRFELKVQPDPDQPAQTITFTRKLFVDE
jgi:hypothetical protein